MKKFFVVLSVFYVVSLLAVPPVSEVSLLKGARFKDAHGNPVENPYFSPLAGAVAWHSGLVESLYRYGPDKEGAIIALVRYLFGAPGEHAAVQVSKTDGSCMINLINEGKWPKIVTHFLAHVPSFDQTLKCIPAKKRSILNSARTYADQKSVDEISFPVETVYMLLSAVWYATVTTLNGRDDIILAPDESLANTIRDFGSITSMITYKEHFIRILHDDQLTDEARLVLLLFNVMSLDYPPYVEQRSYACITDVSSGVPNCVESTLHNIVNALVYDPATHTYDMSFIPADAPIKDFYDIHPVPLNVYSAAAEQKWFNMMEGVANAHYSLSRGGKCELDGDEQNVATVLNNCLGLNLPVPTMADITQKLSSDKQKVTWDGESKKLIIVKRSDCREYELVVGLYLDKGHAEAHFGIKHANVFRDQIIMHDQRYDTLSRLLLDSLMGKDYIVNDKKIDGLSCSWKLLISDTQKIIGNRALDLFRVLASCCDAEGAGRVRATTGQLIASLSYIEEDALEPIVRLYLSPVQVHEACAQEFLKNQKRGILARSVGAVAKNLEDVRTIENIIGEPLDIGQLLIGALTAENKYVFDVLHDEISKMSVADRSKLLRYEDDADQDLGHQHRYNPLYVELKNIHKIGVREVVQALTKDIDIKELFKDNQSLGQRILYASLKAEVSELVQQFSSFMPKSGALRSKILYQALLKKQWETVAAPTLTPEEAPVLLGEKYVRALVDALRACDMESFGKLITKETAPDIRKKIGADFGSIVLTAVEKCPASIATLMSDLSPQDIRKALGRRLGSALQEAVEKDMAELVNVLMKDITPDEWSEFVLFTFLDCVAVGKKDWAIKLLGGLSPQDIRKVLGWRFDSVLQEAVEKDMTELVNVLMITPDEWKKFVFDQFLNSVKAGKKDLAIKLLGGLSPQDIRKALGVDFDSVLQEAVEKDMTELVNVLTKDITPDEWKEFVSLENVLVPIVRLYLSSVPVHGTFAQEFFKNQKRGILARSVGVVAKSIDDVRTIESIIGEPLNIGQLLIGALTAGHKYMIDILHDEIDTLSVADRSKLLLYEDDADQDLGHQHRYNPLYIALKNIQKIGAREVVQALTKDIDMKELFKDNQPLGQRILYASLKAEVSELVQKFSSFMPKSGALRSKILYQALFKKQWETVAAPTLTPEEAPVLLGEKYVRALVDALRACDMESFGKLITKETAPEIRKKLGAVFGSVVSIAVVKKCSASIATLFANILPEEKRTLLTSDNNIIYQAINYNNSEVIPILISDLSPQDIRKALGFYFGYALREAVEKDMAELVNVLIKDITPDEWKEFVFVTFAGVVRAGKKDWAIKLLGGLSPQDIRKALGGFSFTSVLQELFENDMAELVNVLMKDITPDEWQKFVFVTFLDFVKTGKKDWAIKLLGDLNAAQLKKALGKKYELVLENVKDKGMSDLLARLDGTAAMPA